MSLGVFISYAKENLPIAQDIYERLTNEGVNPWLDDKKLYPGHNWEVEIDKALSSADVVILLLSPQSVNKRGFVQKEANDAFERLRYKKETDIYIIPLYARKSDEV